MIKKITEAICDNCGTGIYHISENLSYTEFIKILKERNLAIARYFHRRNPYIFCDEKCLKEWESKNERTKE